MTTARRTPTTPNTSTYGTSGVDYTSLSTWESATDNDLVTATAGEILDVVDDAASFDDSVSLSGATTDASYWRLIRAQAGSEHDGTQLVGANFRLTADNTTFLTGEGYTGFQDLIAESSQNSANGRLAMGASSSSVAAWCVACIIVDSVNAGSGSNNGFTMSSDIGGCILCLAEGNENQGFNVGGGATDIHHFYNCAALNNGGRGFNQNSSETTVLKNCIADNNTTEDYDDSASSKWGTSTHLSSGDLTADNVDGTNGSISQTFTFQTGADNFLLDTTDTSAANDGGTDLSADATYPFDEDILGNTFVTWDQGLNEPDPATGGGMVPFRRDRRTFQNSMMVR